MRKIIDNIEIYYEKEAENFIDELIDYLIRERNAIYRFFNFIPKERIKIKIVPTISELRRIYENSVREEDMPKWVVGFSTLDKTAHLLSFNQYKNTPNYRSTLEDYKITLVHEFIHAIHDIFSGGHFTGLAPIWEGVAVYLSNQYREEGELSISKDDLINKHQNMREYYFFFKYVLETYDHETVLNILANKIDGNIIIDEIYAKIKGKK